jgi:subtilisin family serine protease
MPEMTRTRSVAVMSASLVALVLLAGTSAYASNDPYFSKQWGLTRIQAEPAWATATGAGTTIAVVDTGVDLGHPDLAGNIVGTGRDFVEGDNNAQDENGHGTHVAGIAAAVTGNGVGVAGTAPDASILPVRVLDEEGSGSTEEIAAGIRWAADNGADVINLSLGFLSGVDKVILITGGLEPVYDAIDHANSLGVVVVAAAGNDSFPLCSEPSGHPDVVCVGATDQRDARSWFSNSDATMTSQYLVAPGGDGLTCASDIWSTYLRTAESFCAEAGYEALAGTSMAAPFVSGVAALVDSKGLGRDAIIACLLSKTDDLGTPGRDPIYGYGRVNASKAVTC